jgi:hypothetical protein
MNKVEALADRIGHTQFARTMTTIYQHALHSGVGSLNRNTPNREVLRALIWLVAVIPDPEMIDALRHFASWSVLNTTAQANTIGIALAVTESPHSASALRMIETSAKRPSPRTRFGRFASHVERKLGISPEDSAEQNIPTFDLDSQGACEKRFTGKGGISLRIEGTKVRLHFHNNAGKEVASAPAIIKREHSSDVQEMRSAVKALGQLLTAQRDRIEQFMAAPRVWNFAAWRERYINHPVVGTLARRLIWTVDEISVSFDRGCARGLSGAELAISPSAKIRLWHPIDQPPELVQAWRTRLQILGITQPFKQAHREVYLLTEAERRTATYSNRFAGHILRQAHFRALVPARKWQAPFLGGWDGGDGGVASRELNDGWRIEFWVNASGEQHAESGGMLYVSTDQVRFYAGTEQSPSPLEQVPALIFSEAMRDVDLFVSVTSIGTDPVWRDGGGDGPRRDYWERFAFGELAKSAATRREVLQQLVPRLKIADRCSFTERHLVIRGQLRTYRIHLGSASILMEPNDQYLCIVPNRQALPEAQDCFLPFEGDSMLSLIVSKAFLLAEDSKITDPTIVRQIGGHLGAPPNPPSGSVCPN